MENLRRTENDRRWFALAVLATGVLVSIGIWHLVRSHERTEVRWATKLAGEGIRTNIKTDMDWQMVGLDRLSLLWDNPDARLWTENAELYIQHRPGAIAVERLTDKGERRALVTNQKGRSLPLALAFDGLPKVLLEAVASAKTPLISAPVTLSNGDRQWAIAYPVYRRGQLQGFIVAFFDLKQSIDYILEDCKDLGFSYAIVPPNQPEYLLPGSRREHEQEWGELVDVPLPGVTWQVRIWPKTDAVNVIKSSLPELSLVAGGLLSVLLSLTIYFALSAALSSARSSRANTALQYEITLRQGAEEELRRAHADLESRIEQRTAELHKEIGEHQRAEHSLRELTGRLFQSQEEERRRLARELHDGTTQNLVSLALNVSRLRHVIPSGNCRENEVLSECVRLIEQSIEELRTMSYLLHPPLIEERGLLPAICSYVDGFSQRSGIQVKLDLDPHLGRLDKAVELGIFRVVQEGLGNVHRHSGTQRASIRLSRNSGDVHLEIADEGRGIPAEVLAQMEAGLTGVGIASMRERVRLLGGGFNIDSSSHGTLLCIVLPVSAEHSLAASSTA